MLKNKGAEKLPNKSYYASSRRDLQFCIFLLSIPLKFRDIWIAKKDIAICRECRVVRQKKDMVHFRFYGWFCNEGEFYRYWLEIRRWP